MCMYKMASKALYMVVLMDSSSDNYDYGVYETKKGRPHTVYTSLDAAKTALGVAAGNFDEFIPTAYGKAFPYDTLTFEQQLEKEFFAPWGWGVMAIDDEVQRICVGLIAISAE